MTLTQIGTGHRAQNLPLCALPAQGSLLSPFIEQSWEELYVYRYAFVLFPIQVEHSLLFSFPRSFFLLDVFISLLLLQT